MIVVINYYKWRPTWGVFYNNYIRYILCWLSTDFIFSQATIFSRHNNGVKLSAELNSIPCNCINTPNTFTTYALLQRSTVSLEMDVSAVDIIWT